MLEHWKTLQEGRVNAINTLYDLFLILYNLLYKGESLNKLNTISQLQNCAKEMQAKFAEISEITRIRQTNSKFSFQTRKRRNFGASFVLLSAKFRKQGD